AAVRQECRLAPEVESGLHDLSAETDGANPQNSMSTVPSQSSACPSPWPRGWFDRNMPNRPGLFLSREFIDPLGRLRKKVLACRKGLDGVDKLSPSRLKPQAHTEDIAV